MKPRRLFWYGLLPVSALALVPLLLAGAWMLATIDGDEQRFVIVAGVMGVGFGLGLLLVMVWAALDLYLFQPLEALGRGCEIITHANAAHQLELPERHLLGELPPAMCQLADRLHGARTEVAKALTAGGARLERLQARLTAILRELDAGILVCDRRGRITLYNQAAQRILGASCHLGLGRSLFSILARAPLVDAMELLSRRAAAEQRSRTQRTDFVCASCDGARLLSVRMTLLPPAGEGPGCDFVIAFEDITRRLDSIRSRDRLLVEGLESLRGPLANLRLAADNLGENPGLERELRDSFLDVVAIEARRLSATLESIDGRRKQLSNDQAAMADIHSPDLVASLQRRLAVRAGPTLTAVGSPLWLHIDSHAVLLMLEQMVGRLQGYTGSREFDVQFTIGDRHAYLDLVWCGQPVPGAVIREWLEAPLGAGDQAMLAGQVLNLHGSDLWSQPHQRSGWAVLRIPLPVSQRQWMPPAEPLPPRPEFFDFDLVAQEDLPEDWMDRPLAQLDYVVFDTETTGLRPGDGDEIISVAGVRVVNRRILSGEVFDQLVDPGRPIPLSSVRFHHIDDEAVRGMPPIQVVLPRFREFVGEEAVLVAHNAAFDLKFLSLKESATGVRLTNPVLDVLLLSLLLHDHVADHTLDGTARRLGVEVRGRHTAIGDSLVTAEVFLRLLDLLLARGITTLGQALQACRELVEARQRRQGA